MSKPKQLFVRRSERTRVQIRRKAIGRARLSVFRSSKHIYAQIIDDEQRDGGQQFHVLFACAVDCGLGDLVEQLFVYDGKSLTLYQPQDKVYAQVAAPGTLEELLDFAREKYDVVAPFGDMIFKNAYDILMDGVTDGLVVGKAVIEGAVCDHLAFRAPDVDWQIWIQEGAQPLPRRIVITTLDLPNAPQFAVTVTRWNLEPAFDAQTFTFTPQAGMKQIELLPR